MLCRVLPGDVTDSKKEKKQNERPLLMQGLEMNPF